MRIIYSVGVHILFFVNIVNGHKTNTLNVALDRSGRYKCLSDIALHVNKHCAINSKELIGEQIKPVWFGKSVAIA